MTGRVAILGAGRRAAGWAARLRLMGQDVTIHAPEIPPGFGAAELAAARAALPALYDVALPEEGGISPAPDVAAAVAGADRVIEAMPDAEEQKRAVFAAVQAVLPPGRPVLTTASHLPLDRLRAWAVRGEDIVALRAVEPVWLMPTVSVEGGSIDGFLDRIGMAEAAAPGLDAARGLLAAAGAETGTRVALLRALKARRAGAGEIIAAHEARIAPAAPADLSRAPVTVLRQVPPDWVDYNGHMNEARYLTAFSDAADRLLLWAGMDAACIAAGHSVFTVETHIRHLGEVDIGDRIEVTTRVLDGAGKRLHLWHEMRRGGDLSATGEQLLLHVDLATRRVAPPREDVGAWLAAAATAQAHLPLPEGLGRFVGQPRD